MSSTVIYSQLGSVWADVFPERGKKTNQKAALTHRHPSVVAGAAGNEDQSPTPLDLFDVVLQSTQDHWRSHTSS